MALGINKVILVGNLGNDPEIRTLESGAKLATFSIATTESYKDREGNKQENTEWHRIVAWRGLADIIERYVRKGTKLYVEGKLSTRSYEQDGVTKYLTEVVVRELLLLDSRGNSMDTPPPPAAPPAMASSGNNTGTTTSTGGGSSSFSTDEQTDEDDLPF
jgi:single-strand DNA-binding protein